MRKSIILTAAILLLCSYTTYAEKDCTTKYQELRDSISEEEITKEEKTQVYKRLSDAEKFCNAGNAEEEEKVLRDVAGMVALDEVFSDPE